MASIILSVVGSALGKAIGWGEDAGEEGAVSSPLDPPDPSSSDSFGFPVPHNPNPGSSVQTESVAKNHQRNSGHEANDKGVDQVLTNGQSGHHKWKSVDSLDSLDGIPGNVFPKTKSRDMRERLICGATRLFFEKEPLKIVRGEGTRLIDEKGNYILDCINNVACVGHCHPDVVKAATEQMVLLATNTRFLHDTILTLAQNIVDTFKPLNSQLECCLFVNSGSEANDLALRMARVHTGANDVMVLDHAYHGHLTSMIEISPYKFNQLGGGGQKRHVHVVEVPDKYRGKYRDDEFSEEELSRLYLDEAKRIVTAAKKTRRRIAAFYVESIQSCGGQICYPRHWLRDVFEFCREEGIVSIADEVQTGFGRVGTHFWSFEAQEARPDVVVLGKPMGNGHPVSCVVITRKISESFANSGLEYFNTFGGNPVSCAIALTVIDVIKREKLQDNAKVVGNYLKEKLFEFKSNFSIIGDIRGEGLILGIDLVLDKSSRRPATKQAGQIKVMMLKQGVLLSTDGPFDNVLKFKPPMVFSLRDADELLGKLRVAFNKIDLTSC